MIQHAFTSAYTNRISAQNQTISTISAGIKDTATLALGVAGISGALGGDLVSKAAGHMLAGRVGGVGGNIMLASIQEKQEAVKERQRIAASIGTRLENITQKAQQLETPFNKLLNKRGMIETSMGEIDPSSELGRKITSAEEVK